MTRRGLIPSIIALAFWTTAGPCSVRPADGAAPARAVPIDAGVEWGIDSIARMTVQEIALPTTDGSEVEVEVLLGDAAHLLRLRRHSMRGSGFRVLVPDGDGGFRAVDPPPVATRRGEVVGVPGSTVCASLGAAGLTARIDLGADGGTWAVQPARDLSPAPGAADRHVSYRVRDVAPGAGRCGAGEIPQPFAGAGRGGGGGAAASAGALIAEVGIEADWQFYQLNDESVAETVMDIESVMNTTDFVFERDATIVYEITTIVVRTSPGEDPYTSNVPGELLEEFRSVWNNGPETWIFRDLAQLFTGRDLSGSVIGVAWLGVVCQGVTHGHGYSVVQSRFTGVMDHRVGLTVHELGHNWDSGHCDDLDDCHIMCSHLNGCEGLDGENLRLGQTSLDQIMPYRDARDCLVEMPEPLSVPFLDTFAGVDFDPARWIWTHKAEYSTEALNEPTAPVSMLLNAGSDEPYRDDQIRSNVMLLAGASDLIVSCWTQRRGVEAGEMLHLEYVGMDGLWHGLDTLISDGIDEDVFVRHAYDLPADGYHDGFRLRFRTDADELDDFWYVDNVYVGPVPPACPADLDGDGLAGFTDLLEVLASWGPCPGCPADIDGPVGVPDGEVGFYDVLVILSNWGPCE